MIGSVTLDDPDGPIVLILGDDLLWSCAEVPELAGAQNALYPPGGYSPADGQPGYAALHETARAMGGTVTLAHRADTEPPGRVY